METYKETATNIDSKLNSLARLSILSLILIVGLVITLGFILAINLDEIEKKIDKENIVFTHPAEYHMNIEQDKIIVYSEDGKVLGELDYERNPQLDSLILSDYNNQ